MTTEEVHDVIGVSETWLDDSHGEGEYALNNYVAISKLRDSNPNRGGILAYIRKGIEFSTLEPPKHDIGCKCEHLWLRIHSNNRSVKDAIIGIIYRSHRNKILDFLDHLKSDLGT